MFAVLDLPSWGKWVAKCESTEDPLDPQMFGLRRVPFQDVLLRSRLHGPNEHFDSAVLRAPHFRVIASYGLFLTSAVDHDAVARHAALSQVIRDRSRAPLR